MTMVGHDPDETVDGYLELPIDEVRVTERFRKDLGDLGDLQFSLEVVGQLQPVVLDPDKRLIAGHRRLEAIKRLGWETIKAVIARDIDTAAKYMQAELDENIHRKELTPEEALALFDTILACELPESRMRRLETLKQNLLFDGQPDPRVEKLSTRKKASQKKRGRAEDIAAKATGKSRTTLRKARKVIEAAKKEPEKFGPVVEEMNRTNKVDRAFKIVTAAERGESAAPAPEPEPQPAPAPEPQAAREEPAPPEPFSPATALPLLKTKLRHTIQETVANWPNDPLLCRTVAEMLTKGKIDVPCTWFGAALKAKAEANTEVPLRDESTVAKQET